MLTIVGGTGLFVGIVGVRVGVRGGCTALHVERDSDAARVGRRLHAVMRRYAIEAASLAELETLVGRHEVRQPQALPLIRGEPSP